MEYDAKKKWLLEKYSEGTPFGDNFINLLHDLFYVLDGDDEPNGPGDPVIEVPNPQ